MTLRDLFLLDPTVAFLNQGSFGAAPRPVMQDYQEWQIRLEREPVQFMATELPGLLAWAREALGGFVGARPEDLVFVPNATYAVNALARSIKLDSGDEVLATDHEYGAFDRTWQFACQESGARYTRQPIEFMRQHDWPAVRAECHTLLRRAVQEIGEETGLTGADAADDGFYHQMGIAPLPPVADVREFQKSLYQEHRVEVPILEWNGRPFVRISVQGYKTQSDLDRLRQGLEALLSNAPR